MASRPKWMTQARCAENPALADLWFSTVPEDMATAKRVCNDCPVKSECLDEALKNEEAFGVWGGLTPRARRPLRKAAALRIAPPKRVGGQAFASYYGTR